MAGSIRIGLVKAVASLGLLGGTGCELLNESERFGDDDCSDFSTQSEAQALFIDAGGPAADPHNLDADDDGIACEALPTTA